MRVAEKKGLQKYGVNRKTKNRRLLLISALKKCRNIIGNYTGMMMIMGGIALTCNKINGYPFL